MIGAGKVEFWEFDLGIRRREGANRDSLRPGSCKVHGNRPADIVVPLVNNGIGCVEC